MNRHLLIAGAAVVALSLAACGQKTETQGAATSAEQAATPAANPAATIITPANEAAAPVFVAKAGASDMFEVEAAKLAEQRSQSPEVKKYAAEMIRAHTQSTEALKKAIADSGQTQLAAPGALPSDLQAKLADLSKADNFDVAYMENQVGAHQDALNLMQRYAQDGDVPAIKSYAAATAPVVQQHYDHAKALRDAVKK